MEVGSSTPSLRVELEFAELHAPLFLGGKNHQMKLKTIGPDPLRMTYDREQRELLVYWKQHVAIVPLSNVSCMWPKTDHVAKEALKVTPPTEPIKAQADTPMSHVFAGPGKGKTGR